MLEKGGLIDQQDERNKDDDRTVAMSFLTAITGLTVGTVNGLKLSDISTSHSKSIFDEYAVANDVGYELDNGVEVTGLKLEYLNELLKYYYNYELS